MTDDVDRAVEQVLSRRRRELAVDELEALDLALRVDCPPPPRGCRRPAGQECVSLAPDARGEPLRYQLFHQARGAAGGVVSIPTTERERTGTPRRMSEAARARRLWELERRDLPGYLHGRRVADGGW